MLKDAYKQNDDTIIKVDSGTITVKNSANKAITIVQGEEEITFSGGVFVSGDNVSIPATFDSKFTLDAEKTNLNASMRSSAIKLTGNDKNNSILCGKSNDTLDGGLRNDTLTGGAGSDVFVYSGGNDTITDYGTGSGKISTTSYFMSYTISENDITFTFDDGTLKLEGAADSLITINGVAGKYSNDGVLNSKGTAIKLKSNASTYTAGETVVTIDGSQTNGATVTGNIKNNQFYAGSGADIFTYEHIQQEKTTYTANGAVVSTIYSSGSDVLYNFDSGDKISFGADVVLKNAYKKNTDTIINVDNGTITVKNTDKVAFTQVGKGSNYLYGGDGDDTFIFQSSDGKDTILDFTSDDILKILDADDNASSFTSKYSSGTLTVADSGGTIYLKNLTTATNININGTNYTISGTTLK